MSEQSSKPNPTTDLPKIAVANQESIEFSDSTQKVTLMTAG